LPASAGVLGVSDQGPGVKGVSHSDLTLTGLTAPGVLGVSDVGQGVAGISNSNVGILGQSQTAYAVVATTVSGPAAVAGTSAETDGVQGTSLSSSGSGVIGENQANGISYSAGGEGVVGAKRHSKSSARNRGQPRAGPGSGGGHLPHPPVQGAQADLGLAQAAPDPRRGPGSQPLQQRSDPSRRGPPRGRSARPAVPSAVNRLIHRRCRALNRKPSRARHR
jgi:hypothetical protein